MSDMGMFHHSVILITATQARTGVISSAVILLEVLDEAPLGDRGPH